MPAECTPLRSQSNRPDSTVADGGGAGERPALFSRLLAETYTLICSTAHLKEFAPDEMLYLEGDPVRQVLLVVSGLVKITQVGPGGSEVILRLAAPGEVLGAVGLLSIGRQWTTAQVVRRCRALVWDSVSFKALLERFPVVHENLARILGEYVQELEARFREVATERVEQRVAGQLVRLLKTIGRPVNGAVEIGVSREHLAQMTGTTLFTVSRLLTAWQARGVVVARRQAITICDIESLRMISEENQGLQKDRDSAPRRIGSGRASVPTVARDARGRASLVACQTI